MYVNIILLDGDMKKIREDVPYVRENTFDLLIVCTQTCISKQLSRSLGLDIHV